MDLVAEPQEQGNAVGGRDYASFREKYPHRWPYLLEVLGGLDLILEAAVSVTVENRVNSRYSSENLPGYA